GRQKCVGYETPSADIVTTHSRCIRPRNVTVEEYNRDSPVVADAGHSCRQLRGCENHTVDLIPEDAHQGLVSIGTIVHSEGKDLPAAILKAPDERGQY